MVVHGFLIRSQKPMPLPVVQHIHTLCHGNLTNPLHDLHRRHSTADRHVRLETQESQTTRNKLVGRSYTELLECYLERLAFVTRSWIQGPRIVTGGSG